MRREGWQKKPLLQIDQRVSHRVFDSTNYRFNTTRLEQQSPYTAGSGQNKTSVKHRTAHTCKYVIRS